MLTAWKSRKLWIVTMTLAAICIVALTNHASGDVVSALVTVGGGGAGIQALLDYKGTAK